MSPPLEFRVVLFNPSRVFYAGQPIQGQVLVDLDKPKDLVALKVEVKGEGYVHWTTTRTVTENGSSRTETDHHSASEVYVSMEVMVYPGPRLEAGQHMFPFTFMLPHHMPSSFEGQYGHVRYYVQAVIERSWKWNHRSKEHISVCSLLDLNLTPSCREPGQIRKHKTFCCLCCRSGPVSADISTNRTGYVPGEAIIFSAEIDNQSNKMMNGSSVNLVECVTYRARDGYTRRETRVVASQGRGEIPPGTSDYWEGVSLGVPPLPPSGLGGHCSIMEVEYGLQFRVDPAGIGMDLVLDLGLLIGTIPLIGYMPHLPQPPAVQPPGSVWDPALFPPPASPYLPPPSAPALPDTFQQYADLPPPSYGESVWGQVDVKGEDDAHTMGDFVFVPKYPTYGVNPPQ